MELGQERDEASGGDEQGPLRFEKNEAGWECWVETDKTGPGVQDWRIGEAGTTVHPPGYIQIGTVPGAQVTWHNSLAASNSSTVL